VNYKAADALVAGVQLDRRQPLLVATFVNLEVLTESSRLGRLFPSRSAAGWPSAATRSRSSSCARTCS
jgi:hypothetical protein